MSDDYGYIDMNDYSHLQVGDRVILTCHHQDDECENVSGEIYIVRGIHAHKTGLKVSTENDYKCYTFLSYFHSAEKVDFYLIEDILT